MGCGIGIESLAIQQVFQADTLGIDISRDAIDFANRNFIAKGLTFSCQAISEDTEFKIFFNLILAIEFYPFTRTNDYSFQSGIFSALVKTLPENGLIVLYQKWNNEQSIRQTYQQLAAQFNCEYIISDVVDRRLSRFLPLNKIAGVLIIKFKKILSVLLRKEYSESRILNI